MEEGSLLQIALEHAKTLHTTSACESLLKNCILVDVYTLGKQSKSQEDHLLSLAELACYCNNFFQNKHNFWHYGADGPVFGVHVDQTAPVPHLRAYCRYGPSVQDCWVAIHCVKELIKSVRGDTNRGDIVASVWDVQDGQIILIQLADLLPPWLDEDSTDNHRYACWIDHEGNLQLFRKPHITLKDALEELNQRKLPSIQSSSHPKMQQAFAYWLDLNVQAASIHQRAPMVLPRIVARAFRKRPDLIHTAIQAFCENIQQDGPITPDAIQLDLTKYEDWVWTVQAITRTNYAMARTVSSSQGDWTSSPDSVPILSGAELKRYKRQCKMESMKHLRHAVSLGVRAVAGLELLMDTNSKQNGIFASSPPLSSLEERVLHWSRVQHHCSDQTTSNSPGTIIDNFQMGPNRANLDLTNVLKCPVFPEEGQNWTSFSNPQISLRDQIKNILRSEKNPDADGAEEAFWVPRADQVDGEEWMDYELTKSDSVDTIESKHDVDNLLSRFQSFLKRTSDVEGISSETVGENNGGENVKSRVIEIRPRVFLNILHTVLKGKDLRFERVDPFFYREDYDLMVEDSEDDYGEDDPGNDFGLFKMNDLMGAMDNELQARTESRRIPKSVFDASDDDMNDEQGEGLEGSIDEDVHILNNLLQSIDASGGGTGPVVNILKEMERET